MLPEGQQSKEHYLDNVTSPQFRQALESLTEALNSENFFSVIQSFGLDSKIAQGSLDGVEAFIKCIIQKYKEGKEDK